MYRDNQHLHTFNTIHPCSRAHTRSSSDLRVSKTLQKCKDYRLSVCPSIFTLICTVLKLLHLPIYTISDMSQQERKSCVKTWWYPGIPGMSQSRKYLLPARKNGMAWSLKKEFIAARTERDFNWSPAVWFWASKDVKYYGVFTERQTGEVL